MSFGFNDFLGGLNDAGQVAGSIDGAITNTIFGTFGGATKAVGGGIGNIAGGLTSNPIFLIAGAVVLLIVLK